MYQLYHRFTDTKGRLGALLAELFFGLGLNRPFAISFLTFDSSDETLETLAFH